MPPNELRADQLHRVCDSGELGFETTEQVEPLTGVLGQQDSADALEFGLTMVGPGYHIFVVGQPSSGRTTLVRELLRARAGDQSTPPDYAYVFNFEDPRRPRALVLPAGSGKDFRETLGRLITELREAIPEALASESVAARRTAILEEQQKRTAEVLDELRRELGEDPYIALVGNLNAMMVVPARDGEALDREAYLRLTEDEQARIDEHARDAKTRLLTTQQKVQALLDEARRRTTELDKEVANSVARQRTRFLEEYYAELEWVRSHFESMARDIVEHVERFSAGPAGSDAEEEQHVLLGPMQEDFFNRYSVNVLVSREPDAGAPIIEEPHPHLTNLLGRIEQHVRLGVASTDFRHIAPGALHRANGGYLILEAKDVLVQPLVWPALKRVLRTRELKPAEIASEFGLVAGESLEPEPMPVDLKVVLIGEPELYYVLAMLDNELAELFKTRVDFRPSMERSRETEHGYARLVAGRCRVNALPAFEGAAVAALIEEGSRMASDSTKLTTRLGAVVDLVDEAAYWARIDGHDRVRAADVERANAERDRRNNRQQRELLDLIERGILTFEPDGESVGQLYGIGLISMGGPMFGRPIRVMASAFLGTGGVINIEREAKLSGRIHSKGFLVLSGYLGRLFAKRTPLILSASLSFEQIYEEVEGDSASVAELYALLSAIGEVPLRQGIAVTGAISQQGLVLPVGGLTEKVEGFFKACERKGLNGDQGVLLPRRNIDALTLRSDVRDAVRAGRFHLWAIDTVEEGWKLLSGREAGEVQADGTFPEATVHHAVFGRLAGWAGDWRRFIEAGARTTLPLRADQTTADRV